MALIFCTLTLLLMLTLQLAEMYGLPFGLFEGEIKEATTQELEHLANTADAKKNILELWFAERRGDASAIAKLPYLSEMAPSPALAEWLDVVSYTYRYTTVRILDPISGITLVGSSGSQAAPPLPAVILNSARRPGYEETIILTAGTAERPPLLHFIRQVGQEQSRDNTPVALLDLAVEFESAMKLLWDKNLSGALGKSGEALVVNNNLQFVTSTRHLLADGKPVVPLLTVNHEEPARLAIEGGDGTIITTDYRGVRVLAAYRHIPLNPEISWGLVVKLDEIEALEPVQGQLRRAMSYMAAASVITLLSTIFLARYLSRPLRRITLTAGEIEAGDLSRRVPLEGSNETIALGQSFNTMVERLAQSQESLEEKVQARTKELADMSKRQEGLLAAIPDIIMEVDASRVYTWGNRTGIQFFGDNVIGREASFYFEGEEDTYQKTLPLIDGRVDVLHVESWQRRWDGQIRLLEWWCKSYKNEQGAVTGGLFTARDITERKRAEEEKKHMQTQLQQAQKMESIGTLAGGIAHDFNNILGAILGYAEMAQESIPPGSMLKQDIDQVVKASHRAKDLVKQILAFSRQDAIDHIPLRPGVIIKEALKMLRSSLPSTIDIQQDIDPEAGLILADPTQIHQVMVNLCTNAFHAMEETGGTLTISLKKKTLSQNDLANEMRVQPGDFVQLSISDTGPGIAPEIQEKIFDPYFTTKEVGKGTGMGLAIIHGIAKSYKGFVTCHSGLGEGTVFHVYLPIIADPTIVEVETAPLDLTQLGNERILFIDDDDILAEMGKIMLERLGYRVTVRTNSIEALETFQNQPDQFDLIITDQTMPGMTGSDMARRMLQIRPEIPIILCTGYSTLIAEGKAKLLGIKGFAMKPLAKKDIAALIRQVLDGGRLPGSIERFSE
jgi:PAS domain S-box-containing protein